MKLFFRKLGEGPPIVILHGFLGTSDNWITVARKLQDRFTVYLVDQRNHGLSPHSDDHSLDLMASDLNELIVNEGLVQPTLIGHSMGGKVVMQWALDHLTEFRSLIIVDIAPKEYPAHHHEIFAGLKSINIDQLSSRQEADEALSEHVEEAGVRQFLLKNLDRNKDGYKWKANLDVLERSQDYVGKAIAGANLTELPVYFIRGSNSDYVTREDRDRIKELFPNAKIMSIKDAGHWVHADQPEAFQNTLEALLGSS